MKKVMTHIVGGYPSLEENEAIVELMAQAGSSFVEIQIPFSDPLADGPTIAHANQLSLDNGTTVEDCFQLMKRLQNKVEVPLLFMTYINIIFNYGIEAFCARCGELGVYGLIVPDMPHHQEARDGFLAACKRHGLKAIQVVSPITPDERLRDIAEVAEGFLYCVATTGKTGARTEMDTECIAYLDRVREFTDLPLALGFGISSRAMVDAALQKADIAVIGSAVINRYRDCETDKMADLKNFLTELIQ